MFLPKSALCPVCDERQSNAWNQQPLKCSTLRPTSYTWQFSPNTKQPTLLLMKRIWARNLSVFLDGSIQWWVFNKGWRVWREISWPLMTSRGIKNPRPGTYVNCGWKNIAETCGCFFMSFPSPNWGFSASKPTEGPVVGFFFTPREHICGRNISFLTLQCNPSSPRTSVVV